MQNLKFLVLSEPETFSPPFKFSFLKSIYSRLSFNSGLGRGSYLSSSSDMQSTDLIVVCGSRQFPVHKERLREVSPTLEAILDSLDEGGCVDVNNNDSDQTRKVQDRVIVDNVNGEIFEKILNFIYNGSIEFSDDCVKILIASDLYQVWLMT